MTGPEDGVFTDALEIFNDHGGHKNSFIAHDTGEVCAEGAIQQACGATPIFDGMLSWGMPGFRMSQIPQSMMPVYNDAMRRAQEKVKEVFPARDSLWQVNDLDSPDDARVILEKLAADE